MPSRPALDAEPLTVFRQSAVSFASSLYRAAITGLLDAATEAKQNGTFNYLEKTITSADLNKYLSE